MNLFATFRNFLRIQKRSSNFFVRKSVSALYKTFRFTSALKIFFTYDIFRMFALFKSIQGGRLHQTTALTRMDRYPVIFNACQSYLGERKDLNILSFGCSTGEEVVTLRSYFPSARIVGSEINPKSLNICHARKVDKRIVFIDSNPDHILHEAPFDAIFCMAVLQRTPDLVKREGIQNLDQIYPFSKFEAQLEELDALLKENGIMVVHNTQYQFLDTSIASKYIPLVGSPESVCTGFRFDRNANLIQGYCMSFSIFIKTRK
jgi:hypothetical protein